MQFTTRVMSIFFAFMAMFATFAAAVPTARDIWNPKVIYPNSKTVWNKGETRTVTWDTSNPPNPITKGSMILLRHNGLITPLILAKDFDLKTGKVNVTVPWVMPGGNYSLVLFGDSGNYSPDFTINS